MPGAGECPIFNKPDSEKLYIAVIDYLLTRHDLDGQRIGFVGGSYGGYWGGKMAYVEPKRLKACVEFGGPIHYTWQKDWLIVLLTMRRNISGLARFDDLFEWREGLSTNW